MKKIIHLDNSEFFRKVVKTFLIEQGVQVESFSTGDEALEAINRGDVSLLIMGMEFADMSGGTFLQKVLNSSYKVNAVILSSRDIIGVKEKMMTLGVKDYIQKSENWQSKLLQHISA